MQSAVANLLYNNPSVCFPGWSSQFWTKNNPVFFRVIWLVVQSTQEKLESVQTLRHGVSGTGRGRQPFIIIIIVAVCILIIIISSSSSSKVFMCTVFCIYAVMGYTLALSHNFVCYLYHGASSCWFWVPSVAGLMFLKTLFYFIC
jgi:hypothetical protein